MPAKVDPARWRRLKLQIDAHWEDGTADPVNIETLQPPWWVAGHGAKVGAPVPVPLDVQEMGVPEELRARVLANEPCPAIARGRGCVVLTTVNHLNRDVRELIIADASGKQESFRPTGFHKFYRPRDQAWVSADNRAAVMSSAGALVR